LHLLHLLLLLLRTPISSIERSLLLALHRVLQSWEGDLPLRVLGVVIRSRDTQVIQLFHRYQYDVIQVITRSYAVPHISWEIGTSTELFFYGSQAAFFVTRGSKPVVIMEIYNPLQEIRYRFFLSFADLAELFMFVQQAGHFVTRFQCVNHSFECGGVSVVAVSCIRAREIRAHELVLQA
jgi:hypothetical protein